MLLHCCLIRPVGKIFLGLNLVLLHLNYLLLVRLNWNCRCLCKQMVIERSNQCNFQSFLLKKKESHEKKTKIVWDLWGEFCHKKHQLHGSVQSHDHQKRILLSKEDDIALLRSEMNFTKNKSFVLIVQPQISVKSCTQNFIWKLYD